MPKTKIEGVDGKPRNGTKFHVGYAKLYRDVSTTLGQVLALSICLLLTPIALSGHVQAGPLLNDGRKIVFVTKSGASKGRFVHIFNASAGTLGPLSRPDRAAKYKVLKNTADVVIFRGPRDTCTLTKDHRVTCGWIGNGTWSFGN